jgi:hypothetical protein
VHITAGEAATLRRDIESTWAETATVYVRAESGPTKGQYTEIVKTGLRCTLTMLNARVNASSMLDRAELATLRELKWDYSYTMPDNAQVEIGGRRWNFRRDTIILRNVRPGSEPFYWMADVVRVP